VPERGIKITIESKKKKIETSFSQKRTRYNNLMLILQLIRKHTQVSRTMLKEMSGLSASTVSLLVDDLIDSNIVKETGSEQQSSRGRKQIILELCESGGYFIVIEVISTGVFYHLYDLICKHVQTLKYDAPKADAKHVTGSYVRALLENNNIPAKLLLGINIIYPGIVDRLAQKLVYSVIIPEKDFFSDDDIDALKKEFPDAKLLLTSYSCVVAYAEYVLSIQPNLNKTLLSVNIFEAVSAAAIIVNEKGERLYDFPIEFGHVIVDREGPLCRCGNRGCLEAIAGSSKLFADLVEKAGLELEYTDVFFDPANIKAMLKVKLEIENGNGKVIEIMDNAAEIIAYALINLTNIIDPSCIFINGLIILLGDKFLSKIKKIYDEHNLKHLETPDLIYLSSIDNDKRLKGAALMVMDEVFAFSYDN